MVPSSYDPSLPFPSILHLRRQGILVPDQFSNIITRKRRALSLLESPKLVWNSWSSCSALDPTTCGRFLLAGAKDGSIAVYDLSKWGGQKQGSSPQSCYYTHNPVAQASRSTRPPQRNSLVPTGHAAAIQRACWYVDSGAFLTASMDSKLLVWDTNAMTPVAGYNPFAVIQPRSASFAEHRSYAPIHSMDVCKQQNYNYVVVSSLEQSVVKVLDIRSGATTNTLVGHQRGGVPTVIWSPTSEYVVASGGMDACVRLWDIRQAGGRACLTVLDPSKQPGHRAYKPHFAHLRRNAVANPNQYSSNITPMDRPVYKLAWEEVGGHELVSCDGRTLTVWDLRSGCRLPRRFPSPLGSNNIRSDKSPTSFPLLVANDTIWVASSRTMYAYNLEEGGRPRQVLKGHLGEICDAIAIPALQQLVTSAEDGVILVWGSCATDTQKKRKLEDRDNW